MRPVLFALALLAAPPALALESVPVESPRARVTLVAEQDVLAPGRPFRVALRQVLAPGWHSYWQNAGDAGVPTEIEFTLPDGARAGPIQWPAPERFEFGPLVNYGYDEEVALPVEITLPAGLGAGQVFTLEATARWLACADVCIPEEGVFRLDLPVEAVAQADPAQAALFRAATEAQPRPSPWRAWAGFQGNAGALSLEGAELSPRSVRAAYFFPTETGVIEAAAPQPLTVTEGRLQLGLTRGTTPLPGRLDGVLTVTDATGLNSAYVIQAPPGPMPAGEPGMDLWRAVLGAFLGGLLLNLMPCVFPILAMKAVGLARLSGTSQRAVRAQAVSYTVGVVLAFLALGGALVGLRAAGVAAGWGFQFTAPVFVGAMAWLMLGVGLNLSGVFAVGGPTGAGQALAAKGGHLGSAATGALAVLVATPCTAPFMAAAIGAALAMRPAAALAIFWALGMGLALPYALLGLAPGLARLLPRPGAWMERLRQLLAFPMYGAAAWLLWVLAQQVGPDGLAVAMGGALLVAFALWALGQAQAAGGRMRLAGRGVAAIGLVAALALLPLLRGGPARAEPPANAWSPARLAELRAAGKPVFVNLTAAWCITCKVNERVALRTDAVQRALSSQDIAYLTGDWTNGDPAIGALLRENGREGVPLYLLYPPQGDPTVLPQILTEATVLEAFQSVTR